MVHGGKKMEITVDSLANKIRIVTPDLYLPHSYLDFLGNSFYLRETRKESDVRWWNGELETLQLGFFCDTYVGEDVGLTHQEAWEQLQERIKDQDTGKLCMTQEAWENLQKLIKERGTL